MTAFRALIAGLLVSAVAPYDASASCGERTPDEAMRTAPDTIATKSPVYAIRHSGQMFKVDLASRTWKPVLTQEFDGDASMVPSADDRWIGISGSRLSDGKRQYWLFDRRSDAARLVYEHPQWGGGIPSFSPDGKFFVIEANYDDRWGSSSRAGLFLWDTVASKLLQVRLPLTVPIKDTWIATRWSADGSDLLIMVRVGDTFKYYAYQPLSKKAERLVGRYDDTIHEHIFTRQGKEIRPFDEAVARSNVGLEAERSPGRNWRAFLGPKDSAGNYKLKIQALNGTSKDVAKGEYDACEGSTLHITGWLDREHLVYRAGPYRFRAYDSSTGKTADLFSAVDGVRVFTW